MWTSIKIKWRHTNPSFSHIIYWSVTEIAPFLSYLLQVVPPRGAATAKLGRPKATKLQAKKAGDRTSATIPAPVDITLLVQNYIDTRLPAIAKEVANEISTAFISPSTMKPEREKKKPAHVCSNHSNCITGRNTMDCPKMFPSSIFTIRPGFMVVSLEIMGPLC